MVVGDNEADSPAVAMISRAGVSGRAVGSSLQRGLRWKEAYAESARLLRAAERQSLTLSQIH